jgi:hypothetical protein
VSLLILLVPMCSTHISRLSFLYGQSVINN